MTSVPSSARLWPGLCPLLVGVLLACLPLAVPVAGSQPQTPAAEEGDKTPGPVPARPGDVEVHFTDGSKMKLSLREKKLSLKTPYGKLVIPIADVHHIELATRIPPEVARQIKEAIADLGSSDYPTRQKASATLLAQGARAYPALRRATHSSDAEVRTRAERLLEKIRNRVAEEQLVERKTDIIHTADSKIAGQIEDEVLEAQTTQFGKVQLKLADVRLLRSANVREEDEGPIAADPGNLEGLRDQVGKSFRFRITGNSTGFVWGTDVYTTDSALATVAVHAGVLTHGQTGVVKVTVVAAQPAFQGSVRNGVTSFPFGPYPAGYKVSR